MKRSCAVFMLLIIIAWPGCRTFLSYAVVQAIPHFKAYC